jgi:hypothetical protein
MLAFCERIGEQNSHSAVSRLIALSAKLEPTSRRNDINRHPHYLGMRKALQPGCLLEVIIQMMLEIWLPGMFLLGLVSMGLCYLFMEACERI